MLNLNELSLVEQIALVVVAFLVVCLVFRILAGLLRIVAFFAVIACLWVFVLQPSMLNGVIDSQAANLSPKVQYAVAEFDLCLKQVVASIGRGGESECKQRAMAVLQQSGGAEYASEASRAIEAFLNESRQKTM
ncbi:MAG: hypothetical protein Q8O64_17955 [Sideroxyarcus sp.]|nr:hypothetical protein [Sideroxyarcus sp.]